MAIEGKAHQSQLELLRQRARAASAAHPTGTADQVQPVDDTDPYDQSDYEWGPNKVYTTAKGGRRQPGFCIVTNEDDACYWIFYHAIRKLRSFRQHNQDYIQFAHDGLAITIQGQRLYVVLTMIGEGRLKSIFNPVAGAVVTSPTEPFITAILVTDVEVSDTVPTARPKLVKDA